MLTTASLDPRTRGTNNKRTLQLRTKVLSSIFVDHETLVVGAAGYVEIWQVPSPAKARLVKRHSLGDYADDDATVPFCRGSASVGGVICVGCSSGEILRFEGDCQTQSLRGHRAPLTCLASSSKLVSGCDRGEIRSWEGDDSLWSRTARARPTSEGTPARQSRSTMMI